MPNEGGFIFFFYIDLVNDDALTDGFKLTRFLVSCCAADGIPLQVSLHGVDGAFENDTWVSVDLVWRSPDVPYQDTSEITEEPMRVWKPPMDISIDTIQLVSNELDVQPCGFGYNGKKIKLRPNTLLTKLKARNKQRGRPPRLALCITM